MLGGLNTFSYFTGAVGGGRGIEQNREREEERE